MGIVSVIAVVFGGLAATLGALLFRARNRSHAQAKMVEAQQTGLAVIRRALDTLEQGLLLLASRGEPGAASPIWEIIECNLAAYKFLNFKGNIAPGCTLDTVLPEAVRSDFLAACARAYAQNNFRQVLSSEIPEQSAQQRDFIRIGDMLCVVCADISDRIAHQQEMDKASFEDPITTLPNRNWLMRHLESRLTDTRAPQALLFIDLDDFKDINDILGPAVGDLLLRAAAMRVKSVIGVDDCVVRLGGDEFAILLGKLETPDDARSTAEMVAEILHFPMELVRGRRAISTSIGISLFPDDAQDASALLQTAEIAMYAAKENGKGHFRFYNSKLYERLQSRLIFEQELMDAIRRQEFVVFYEPRVSLASGKLCGMEALVRWRHPNRGLVPPMEFIGLAESTGLINPLGDIVMDLVCQQIAEWKVAGYDLVPVSINISALQFNSGSLSAKLVGVMQKHAVQAKEIELELTESAMLGDVGLVLKELATIRSLGIRLLIDDFGTGYSSLAQLQSLQMDILKIDRSFTSELGKRHEGEIFVQAMISMAHALGMDVIAEGVETVEQLEVLRRLQCDQFQGYYLSRPIPGDLFAKSLMRQVCDTK